VTTSPSDLLAPIREALAAHEILRTLGFPSADIYVRSCKTFLQVVLRSQAKEFVIDIAPVNGPDRDLERLCDTADQFTKAWQDAVQAYNVTFTDSQRKEILEESKVRENAVDLLAAMILKGFTFQGKN